MVDQESGGDNKGIKAELGKSALKLVDKLNPTMAFMIVCDYIVGGQILNFYKAQSANNDPLRIYTVAGFWLYLAINLWIIYRVYRISAVSANLANKSNPKPRPKPNPQQ